MFHFQNDISFSQIYSLILKQHTQLQKPLGTLGCKFVIWGWFFFLSFQFCDVTKLAIINKNIWPNLAIYPIWAFKKKPISFWLPVGTCCRDMVVFILIFLEIWQIRAVFFALKKPFNVLKSYFSKFEFAMWRI